jgi:hypothetical protein
MKQNPPVTPCHSLDKAFRDMLGYRPHLQRLLQDMVDDPALETEAAMAYAADDAGHSAYHVFDRMKWWNARPQERIAAVRAYVGQARYLAAKDGA